MTFSGTDTIQALKIGPVEALRVQDFEFKTLADEPLLKAKTDPADVSIVDIVRVRTHHRFLHPTKGWRMFSRPGKANRRRKLIHMGVLNVPLSHEYAKEFRLTNKPRAALRRDRAELAKRTPSHNAVTREA